MSKRLTESPAQPPAQDRFGELTRAPDGRARVLLAAAELFAGEPSHDRNERRIFAELARQLLPEVEIEERRQIAALIARHPHAPEETLGLLARDSDPEVALPALRHGAALAETDLVAIAARGPEPLRRAIAARCDLAPAVLIALARHAEAATLKPLVGTTVLPEAALAALKARPEVFARLAPALSRQQALPAGLLFTLFLELDPAGRLEAIAAAETRALADLARSGQPRILQAAFKPAVLTALVAAALEGGAAAFAAHLAYALKLPPETAARIVDDPTGEPLVVCLRALGVEDTEASRILVRLLGTRLSLADLRALVTLFNRMTPRAAYHLVTAWQEARTAPAETPAAVPRLAPLYSGTARAERTAPGRAAAEPRPAADTGLPAGGPRREAS